MRHRFLLCVSLGLLLGLVLPASAKSDVDSGRKKIRDMRDTVLAELEKAHPEVKSKIKRAAGYAVFSNVGINVFLASFAGGSGVVVQRGLIHDTETFMKMGSAGVGIGGLPNHQERPRPPSHPPGYEVLERQGPQLRPPIDV